MRYTDIKDCKPTIFKRLIGASPAIFEAMVSVIKDYKIQHRKHSTKGRPSKLSIPDQLLILLMYYREYRTFLHISKSYSISEMHCWRMVTTTESILLQSKLFHLPGKKALHNAENTFEVIVVDVSEHPIERPKKTAAELFWKKETTHPKKSGSDRKKKQKDNLRTYRQRQKTRF